MALLLQNYLRKNIFFVVFVNDKAHPRGELKSFMDFNSPYVCQTLIQQFVHDGNRKVACG